MFMRIALPQLPVKPIQLRNGKSEAGSQQNRSDAQKQWLSPPVQTHVVYPQPQFKDSRLATVLRWGSIVGMAGTVLGAVLRPNSEINRLANGMVGAAWGGLIGGVLGTVTATFQPRPEILAKRRYERENEVKLIPSVVGGSGGYEAIPVITVPGVNSTIVQSNGQVLQQGNTISSGLANNGILSTNTPLIITNQPYDAGYYGYHNHYGMGDALGDALMFNAVSNAFAPMGYRGYGNSDTTHHHHYYSNSASASAKSYSTPRSTPSPSKTRRSSGSHGVGIGASNLRSSVGGAGRSRSSGSGFGSAKGSGSTHHASRGSSHSH